jgi:hypothetical protein
MQESLTSRLDTSHNQTDSDPALQGSFTSTPKNTIVSHGKQAAREQLRYPRRPVESLFETAFKIAAVSPNLTAAAEA